MIQVKIEKGLPVAQETMRKYEAVLPDELLDIWRTYGYATLLDGYLRVINPSDYQELLHETYFRGESAIPILTTGFGDIITLEEDQYIGMVKYKNGTFTILSKTFKWFLVDLAENYFIEKYLQYPQYAEAKERLGSLKPEECFGYIPLLGLGGYEKVENLDKVNLKVHIDIITQLLGRIE